MAEVLLFHHAHGLTPGCLEFADELRAAGHLVHVPDLYDGKLFDELPDGLRYAEQELGLEAVIAEGQSAAETLPNDLVYAGFSLGVLPAQMLAQTRPGARGALLIHSVVPASEFGDGWPPAVPVQMHLTARDRFARQGDLEAARALRASVEHAELFEYPGDRHLFADTSLPDYDEEAAELLKRRAVGFLEGLG